MDQQMGELKKMVIFCLTKILCNLHQQPVDVKHDKLFAFMKMKI